MSYEQIIEQKISFLNGDKSSVLTSEMENEIMNNPSLKQELEFIEAFWKPESVPAEQLPSSDLSRNFYEMLDAAKSSQKKTEVRNKSGIFHFIENLLTPKPVLQFATIMMVFMFGYYMNQPVTSEQDRAMSNLQQEVKSLNTMMALSMLQKSSASERLSGVSYSKQSDIQNPELNNALIELLNSDSSSSVRLAVIDAVYANGNISMLQNRLLDSIVNQKNALVQMSLVRLIMDKGTLSGKQRVMELKNTNQLILEVNEYLDQLNNQQQI